jgi:phospholipase A-2-activating protein
VYSSDGRICIFTKDESRMANLSEISAFEEELASSSIQTKTGDMGEIKIDDLPNEDALKKPGQRDGQTTMINKGGGQIEAYQWNMSDKRWMKIGDVVGSADSTAQGQASATGEKIMFEGKYYDYVFNVELDKNSSLKLPYNINEDPWYAAQAFIHRHELDQMFLDQIAQFIISNTKGMVIDQRASDYTDPFTGSLFNIDRSIIIECANISRHWPIRTELGIVDESNGITE